MTDPTEDRVVEAMARSMCIADGIDPENYRNVGFDKLARGQYRAYLAMQSVLMDLKLVQPVSETTVPLCDHPVTAHERVVARLREWFRYPANGDFEFVDLQAIMIDAGLASRHGCTCFLYDQQVCDICQGIAKDPQKHQDGS